MTEKASGEAMSGPNMTKQVSGEAVSGPNATEQAQAGEENNSNDEDEDEGLDVERGGPPTLPALPKRDRRNVLFRFHVHASSITRKYEEIYREIAYFYPKLGHHGRKWLTKQLLEMGYEVNEHAFALGWSNSVMETIYGHNAIPHNICVNDLLHSILCLQSNSLFFSFTCRCYTGLRVSAAMKHTMSHR